MLKALLQKSRGKGPKVIYSIYMIDQRVPPQPTSLSSFLNPITKCGVNGEGYSNEIGVNPVKHERGKDIIWLTIAMEFKEIE